MVSIDNKSEITVSAEDNIKQIFEEYGAELWSMFILGFLLGLFVFWAL